MAREPATSAEAEVKVTVGPVEAAFRELPALGSPEYLLHIGKCTPSELPAEVLVRAFRQLPPEGDAAKATLGRLFARHGTHWDYLDPLVAYARRQARKAKRDSYEDMLQDAVRHILEVLPTPRGAYAEQSWHAFCRHELSEAWRERHGRRGERFPVEELVDATDDDQPQDLTILASTLPPWHVAVEPNDVRRIEEIACRVLDEMPDDFVRDVAREAWFRNKRPKVSGRDRLKEETAAPLTAAFPKKSRFQITRALRHADSQLAAALLSAPEIEWKEDLKTLERLRETGRGAAADTRER